MKEKTFRLQQKFLLLVATMFCATNALFAQGVAGIDAATSEISTYIDPIGTLVLVVGAVVGFVGAIRCYIKWNSGDQDVQKAVMGWMGSCIFLIVSGVIIKAFFGV
ncbi:DUF4134 domain-containing protein [Parabacteroides sp. PF5-9]|uniref:DUF4134 domain-containing protein n=1 Tax=Parabacteroides sp. PF5-9 TaxID=1742404 RepID=UPI002476F68C|nr:DUF4134 domain-containing protein [Parabacteroides sp. PF5-9]MDH6358932.1 hypothetical protein [Parabacteroides sp. PF5-9]